LLIGKPSTRECLEKAIAGETYEYTEMYPKFQAEAIAEEESIAGWEFREQIAESREHAQHFADVLALAEKRFAALKKVEAKHAAAYNKIKETL